MFRVTCKLLHLDLNSLCGTRLPPVSKWLLVSGYTEHTRFRSGSGKRDLDQRHFSCSGSPADYYASSLETIFSYWVYWTYKIPIRLWKKRSGLEVFFMFGVTCVIFIWITTCYVKTCPPLVSKRFLVAGYIEHTRFRFNFRKKRSGSEVFFVFRVIFIIFHLDQNLLCKTCPLPVSKQLLVTGYTEHTQFRSASGKRGIFYIRGHLHIKSGSQLVMWNLPASGLKTIFSYWVYWTYSIPIQLWKKRSGSGVFFMFGVICIIFHLDQNLLCTCPPPVSKLFLVSGYTEHTRFQSASEKRDLGQRYFSCSGSSA